MYIRHILESGNGSADRWLSDTSLKPIVGCKFGLELEVEGSKIPRASSLVPYWMVVTDGSLRQLPEALEYKTVPLSLDGVSKALGVFEKASSNSVFKPSIRTSTHLHINVQDMTVTQVANFIALYLLLEGSLYEICGKHRKGNVFCIPLTQCDDILRRFGQFCKNQNYSSLRNLGGEGDKYAALSLRSMLFYGTLEVRTHEGVSEKELDRVYSWANLFQDIRNYAMKENVDPISILQTASNMGPVDFTKMFLGEEFNLIDSQSFWDGVSSIQYFANQSKWNPEKPLGLPETPDVEEKKPSKKKSPQVEGNVVAEDIPQPTYGPPREDFLDNASMTNMQNTVPYSDTHSIVRRTRMNYNNRTNEAVLSSFVFGDENALVRLKRRVSSYYGLDMASRANVREYLHNHQSNIGSNLSDYDVISYIANGGGNLDYLGLQVVAINQTLPEGNTSASGWQPMPTPMTFTPRFNHPTTTVRVSPHDTGVSNTNPTTPIRTTTWDLETNLTATQEAMRNIAARNVAESEAAILRNLQGAVTERITNSDFSEIESRVAARVVSQEQSDVDARVNAFIAQLDAEAAVEDLQAIVNNAPRVNSPDIRIRLAPQPQGGNNNWNDDLENHDDGEN